MDNGLLVGLALGAVIGAALVEGNAPAGEAVSRGKAALRKNISKGVGAIASEMKTKKQ
jgi:hypothetical protein